MRILIILPDRKVGGGQIVALRLAEALAQHHEVFTLVAKPEWKDESPPEIPANVTEISLPCGHLERLARNQRLNKISKRVERVLSPGKTPLSILLDQCAEGLKKRSFQRLLKKYRIDLINTHVWWADDLVSKYLIPKNRVPWVITMHGCYEACIKDLKTFPLFKEESYHALSRADKIVYISDKNLEIFDYFEDTELILKTRKIYSGFTKTAGERADLSSLGISTEDFVLGLVSRAIPEKGWEAAIIATRQAREQTGRSIHLILAGESDFQKALEKQYDYPYIHFVGHLKRPLDWCRAFDVGVLPTYFPSESLPNSIVEYLASGLPVIATDIGEIKTMLDADGRLAGQLIGFDASGKPSISDLKDAIVGYITDRNLLNHHARLAEIAFEKFSMPECIQAYETVFLEATKLE